MTEFAVRFEGITKRFPGPLALNDVSLDVAAGACHALCGENGAGKSTLGRMLAGIHVPDAGRLVVHGHPVRFHGVRDAMAAGVAMVHQEPTLCHNLSVAENLALAAIPTRRGLVDRAEMRLRAETMLAEVGAILDVNRSIGELSVAQHQLVQIAAAVGAGARIIIFDEPTSSLSEREAERLFALMGRMRERGITCIYVSHRMPEIYRLCDTVSVLRDGRHVATRPVSEVTVESLVQLMIGRSIAEYLPQPPQNSGDERVLEVRGLRSARRFHDVSFTLHAGEVLGLCGLVGSGRSEIAAALFGLDAGARGLVRVGQREVRVRHPRDAIRFGIGLVPEDRKRQGIVPGESARRNITLAILGRLSRLTWVRRREEDLLARKLVERLRIRPRDIEAPLAGFSGGNQQKVVLGRWLAVNPRILILDEPTRGVDVGAKAEIHALIGELAAAGTAVILISSELPELLRLSQRILVLREGRITGEVSAQAATQEMLMRLMSGVAAVA